MDELECPYCGTKFDDEEPGLPDKIYEQECPECGAIFVHSYTLYKHYTEGKAPCLNGKQEHDWQPTVVIPKEFFKNKQFCSICSREREIPKKKV